MVDDWVFRLILAYVYGIIVVFLLCGIYSQKAAVTDNSPNVNGDDAAATDNSANTNGEDAVSDSSPNADGDDDVDPENASGDGDDNANCNVGEDGEISSERGDKDQSNDEPDIEVNEGNLFRVGFITLFITMAIFVWKLSKEPIVHFGQLRSTSNVFCILGGLAGIIGIVESFSMIAYNSCCTILVLALVWLSLLDSELIPVTTTGFVFRMFYVRVIYHFVSIYLIRVPCDSFASCFVMIAIATDLFIFGPGDYVGFGVPSTMTSTTRQRMDCTLFWICAIVNIWIIFFEGVKKKEENGEEQEKREEDSEEQEPHTDLKKRNDRNALPIEPALNGDNPQNLWYLTDDGIWWHR